MRRLLQIRRRRGRIDPVDPITASYDAILATNPTVPVLLRLRSYRGQQVLFQDGACTIPVEEIGDPIGGVRHPVTGEIIAVQTTDAGRPVWGGVGVGAVFDGVGAHLLATVAETGSSPHSISASVQLLGQQTHGANVIFGASTISSVIYVSNSTTTATLRSPTGTNPDRITTDGVPVDDYGVMTGVYDTTSTLRTPTGEVSGELNPPDNQTVIGIFATNYDRFHTSGYCRWWGFWNRAITLSERETLEALA